MAKMAGSPAPAISPITQIFHRAFQLIHVVGGGQHDAHAAAAAGRAWESRPGRSTRR